ncbi:MAG: DUF1573 domain-containing protein [Verrucomicrobiales bacterium]|nr:DUF1573 domain-containing protein [Verrucomicrobiales bacterium]
MRDSISGTDSPASSSADILSWERSHIDASFHPKDGELILIYPFTVTGKEAVTIKSVTPDCDCLVVPLPQKTFQPGETGQLEVKFLAGTRTGKQERVIEVSIEGQKQVIKLTATIEVPEIINAEPKALIWKVGEDAKSKEITLNLSEALKITSSQSSSKHFQVELIESSPNKIWTIKITPKDTNKSRSSMIMLRTDYPHRPWDRMVINARIEP